MVAAIQVDELGGGKLQDEEDQYRLEGRWSPVHKIAIEDELVGLGRRAVDVKDVEQVVQLAVQIPDNLIFVRGL